jgi:drug/metabolite transporter (DMT)-like permease
LKWRAFQGILSVFKPVENLFADKTKFKKYSIGFLCALSAAIFGSIADVLPKPILEGDSSFDGLDPIVMITVMYLVNSLIFTGITSKRNPIVEIGKTNFMFLVLIGIIEIIATGLFYFGLKDTSATNAAILGNSDIVFTSIIATMVFKESIKSNEYFPYSLIIIGAIIIPIWSDAISFDYQITKFVYGDLLILLAGLFYGIEMNIYRYVSSKVNSKRVLQVISFVGGITALCAVIVLQIPINLRPEDLPIILTAGVFGIGISILLIVTAIKYIGAIRAILIFSTTTLFGIIFSFIILGEEIHFLHFIAFGLIFYATSLLRNRISD